METICYFDIEISSLGNYLEPRVFPIRHHGSWIQRVVRKLTNKKADGFL